MGSRTGHACSTCEAAEQRRGPGGGGGGGKGHDQGEHEQQNASRTQSRERRAQCAGSCARGSTKGQGSAVHGAAAPRRPRPSAGGLLGDQPEGRSGGGRADVGGLRAGPGDEPSGPARQVAVRAVGRTSRRRTGGSVRSASPRWRTRSPSGPSSRCSTPSTRWTSPASPTVSDVCPERGVEAM
jgi:hypothetical protein